MFFSATNINSNLILSFALIHRRTQVMEIHDVDAIEKLRISQSHLSMMFLHFLFYSFVSQEKHSIQGTIDGKDFTSFWITL